VGALANEGDEKDCSANPGGTERKMEVDTNRPTDARKRKKGSRLLKKAAPRSGDFLRRDAPERDIL